MHIEVTTKQRIKKTRFLSIEFEKLGPEKLGPDTFILRLTVTKMCTTTCHLPAFTSTLQKGKHRKQLINM